MSNFLDATGLAYFWGKIKEALNGKADKSTTYTKTEVNGILEDYVEDVKVNNTSVVTDGVANIPIADSNNAGVVKADVYTNGYYGGIATINDKLFVIGANLEGVKYARDYSKPIVAANQHMATFYGLAKASGDTTQAQSANAVGAYTADAKASIQTMLGVPSSDDIISDVQIDGTSIVQNGVANVPIASSTTLGAVKIVSSYGIKINNGFLSIQKCSESMLRSPSGSTTSKLRPVTADMSDMATFFSLARIAGDTTQGASENAIGTYTDDAKIAIRTMLGVDTASILQEVENGLPSAEGVSF